jgi:hypothetical protein
MLPDPNIVAIRVAAMSSATSVAIPVTAKLIGATGSRRSSAIAPSLVIDKR